MPAAAVTPAARVVIVIIGSKGSVAGLVSPPGNLIAQLLGFRGILPDLEPGEVRGTTGVGVKSCNPCGTTCGEVDRTSVPLRNRLPSDRNRRPLQRGYLEPLQNYIRVHRREAGTGKCSCSLCKWNITISFDCNVVHHAKEGR